MKKERLFEAIGNVDEELLARLSFPENFFAVQPEESPKAPGKFRLFQKASLRRAPRYALALCAACLIAAAVFFLPGLLAKKENAADLFPLSDASYGVKVSLVNEAPEFMVYSSPDLIWLTEEELFTYFDTDIFEGTVTGIQNIVLNFNGDKNYRAIASIQVEKVFRGSVLAGDTVNVLLPCMIDVEGVWVSGTDVVSKMRAGMHGIFMPMVYNAASVREQNGARLLLTDLAPYGLADGERYCFLETEDGLVFASFAYESIAEASTLTEIELYIEKMLKDISE